ncbi:DNA polymerase III subunit alpha [Candidatus Xenohaliotis californiensis]|uniref:DNA polymerase III subunit alpha n=2 Tax=Candidatus Xenohaliotis californiensis TaxID=84677 RepID=A0ABP0EWI8_9RICK|nr:DNA polymerase III subunit alpha [Candidatus Xenohaliotis californiensis]
MINLCVDNKMPAVAVTDNKNLYSALEFAEKAVKKGIQPIIGCCISMLFDNKEFDILLLAKNEQGYFNLIKLVSESFIKSAKEPFVVLDEIISLNAGLIMLGGNPISGLMTACAKNKVNNSVLPMLMQAFDTRLYVEIQRHGLPEEEENNELLIDLAYQHNLPLVATNAVFFANKECYEAHDALMCISSGRYVSDENRPHLNQEYYFKSMDEMLELFSDIPEATENAVAIAKRCCFAPHAVKPILPTSIDGGQPDNTLKKYATKGLEYRFNHDLFSSKMSQDKKNELKKKYSERLEYELNIIFNMQYSAYFLIVQDFVNWSKSNGISVGPGRGSGAGSLVTWCLQITNIDPIKYGLIFERFLNPERVSMPDLDIDFCQEKRDRVIDYICKKYGKECVAQIITFGTLQARGVLRDVGRVLQMSYNHVDRLCRMVPNNPSNPVTLSEALDMDANLRTERDSDEVVDRLISNALKLEGLHRHISTHAAGVVISHQPLSKLIPFCVDHDTGRLLTQFSMKYVERAGLIKFDFLGLKTLTMISKVIEAVRLNSPDFDINKIDLDDPTTYELLSTGNNIGLFQLESAYVIDILRNMQPNSFEDIIALISLNRPGPMENMPRYIDRKNGIEEVDYLHPMLKDILTETFGIIVYQEQVMHIAQKMAGYSLGAADLLRRAMGKKIKEEMDQQKEIFIQGSINNGVSSDKAAYIFELVAKFAGYGFNKSHATAYAMISVQTAYLKAHYPKEFFVSLMSLDADDTNKLFILCRDAKLNNINVLPPDINKSEVLFAIEDSISIRYSLSACKNLGLSAAKEICTKRQEDGLFTDVFNFVKRLAGKINKKSLEALIKSGSLDSLHLNRRQLLDSIDILIGYASSCQKEQSQNQSSMFDGVFDVNISKPTLRGTDNFSEELRLQYEFEAFGFYLTKHPIEDYQQKLTNAGVTPISNIAHKKLVQASIAGVVSTLKIKPSKHGKQATISFADHTGMVSCVLYDEQLISPDTLYVGALLYLQVKINHDDGGMRTIAFVVKPLKLFLAKCSGKIIITINNQASAGIAKTIRSLLGEKAVFTNGHVVYFHILMSNGTATQLEVASVFNPSPKNLSKINKITGVVSVICD